MALLLAASLAGTIAILSLGGGLAHAASNPYDRKVCPNFKYFGPTGRVLNFVTFHMSCTAGKKVVAAQYRCRKVRDGSPGICKQGKKILGYKCYEQRIYNRGKPYYDGKVECSKGKQDVALVYRQQR